MQNKKRDGKKQIKPDLEIILATEMGLLSILKRIKVTSKQNKKIQTTTSPNQTRLVDFHMEIAKRVDEVIQKNETENIEEPRIIEERTTWRKTPQLPTFKTEIPKEETNIETEQIELETANNQNLAAQPHIEHQPVFVGPIQPKHTPIFAVGDNQNDKLLTTLGRIKINREKTSAKKTETKPKTKNGYVKTKTSYQKVQTEIERKKHELEEMKRLAKEKEEELKRKEKEREKREKQKAIEQKKREKEEKLRAKQELKLAKQKEIEKKKQEKLKLIEQRKLEKQRQKELKDKERLKELKTKEIEKQQQKELKEKEKQIQEEKKKQEKKPIAVKIIKKKEKPERETPQPKPEPEIQTQQPEPQIETHQPEPKLQPPEDDLIKAFEIIDDLLGKLPDDTINEFVQSDDFEIYEKVVSKYKKK